MYKKSLKDIAESYDKKAQAADKKSSRDKDGPPHERVSKLYKIAGDAWVKAGNNGKAIHDYKFAMKNAYNKMYANKIKDKIQGLSPLKKGIEKSFVFATLAIICLVGALFCVSFNLTGYSIGELTQENFRWVGVCLFACGLIFSFFYFKNKK